MKSRGRSRIVAYTLASVLILLVVIFSFANSRPGRTFVAATIENAASSDDFKLTIEGLDGTLPSWPRARKVTLADSVGPWLILHNVHATWNPLLLLRGQIAANEVNIERIEWLRKPSNKFPTDNDNSQIPVLSFGRLVANDVSISREVAGMAVRFSIDSQVDLRNPTQSATILLKAVEIAPGSARLVTELRFDRARSILQAHANIQDRAGGPLAALAGLPSDAPIAITLSSSGKLDDWRATFNARGGDELEASGTATIQRSGHWRQLALRINAELGSVGPQAWRSFTSGKTQLILDGAQDDLGAVQIDNLQLVAPALEIRGHGLFHPAEKLTEGTISLAIPDGKRVSGLFGSALSWRNLSAKTSIESSWPTPAVRTTVQLEDLNLEFARASRLRLSARAVPDRHWNAPSINVALATVTRAENVVYENAFVQDSLGHTLNFKLQAVVQEFKRLSNITIDLQQNGLKAFFLGNVDPLAASGELSVDAGALTLPHIRANQFLFRAHVAADRETSAWAVRGTGQAEIVSTEKANINKLLTGKNSFEFSLTADAPGIVRISKVALIGPHLEARAQGKIDSNEMHIESRLLAPNLSVIGPEFGGRIDAQMRLTGSLVAPLISGAASLTQGMFWQHRSEKLALALSDTAADGRRSLELSGDLAGKSLSLNADVMLSDADGVQVHRAKMDYGTLTLAGDLTIAESGLIGGTLALKTAALEEIAPLFNLNAAGAIDGRFEFSADDTSQDVRVDVTSSKFRIVDARFSAITISGQAQDLYGDGLFNLDLQSDFTDVDGIGLQGLKANAKRNALGIDLTATAKRGDSTVTGRGRVTAEAAQTVIHLEALTFSRAKQKLRLMDPLKLTIAEEQITFPNAHFLAGGGHIRSTGSLGQDTNFTLEVSRLPLWAIELLGAPIAASGTATGALKVEGRAGERLADFNFEVKHLKSPDARGVARNLTLSLKGSTDRAGLNFQSKLSDTRGRKLRVSGRVPFDKTESLSVEADGSADLAVLNTYISSLGDRVGGPISVSAKISGTPQAPRVNGTANINRGFFRSVRAGIDLRDITVQLTGLDRRVDLTSLAAKVPNSDIISGSGEIHLDREANFPIDLSLTTPSVQLITTDQITIKTGLDAHLSGAFLGAQTMRGTADVSRWDIRVPSQLPRHPAPNNGTNQSAPSCVATVIEFQSDTIENSKCSFGLDLNLRAPRRVLFHGRGIDAEFGGSVKLTGSTINPAVNGRLDLQRGSVSLLSKRISLSQGSIIFSGDMDPALDVSGEWRKHGITAIITVRGKSTQPALSLVSTPKLPQVEILARIIFAKSMSQLSPSEAAKITRAVAGWSSASAAPDLLHHLRQASVIETLSTASGEMSSAVFVDLAHDNGKKGIAKTAEVNSADEIMRRGEPILNGTAYVGSPVERGD